MADEQPPDTPRRIDLSAYVKDLQIGSDPLADLPFGLPFGGLLKSIGPFTIVGYFDDGRVACGNCGGSFMPGPEGTPTLTHDPSGVSLVACPACAVAVLELNVGR